MRSELIDNRTLPIENLATNPSFERVVTGSAVVRRNLASYPQGNGQQGGRAGWTMRGSGANTIFTRISNAIDGPLAVITGYARRSFTGTVSVTDAGFDNSQYPAPLPVAVGRVYTYSVWLRTSVTGVRLRLRVQHMPAASTGGVVEYSQSIVSSQSGKWARLSMTFTASQPYVQLIASSENGGSVSSFVAGDTLDGTGLLLEERPSLLPYFDGTVTDDTGLAYAWEGTANASTSVAKSASVEVRRNYAIDPAATTLGAADGPRIANDRWPSEGTYSIINPSDGPTGTSSAVQYLVTTARSSGHGFHLADNPETSGVSTGNMLPVSAGEYVTVSVYVKKIGTATTMSVRIRGTNGTGWVSQVISTATAVSGTAWTRLSATYLVPSTVKYVAAYVTGGADAVNDIWQATGLLIEKSPGLGSFFSGDYTPDVDLMSAWTGSTNSSQSVLYGVSLLAVTKAGTDTRVCLSWQTAINAQSLRITGGASNDSTVAVAGALASLNGNGVRFEPGQTYTAIATIRLTSTLTGTLHTNTRRMSIYAGATPGVWVDFYSALSTIAPNAPGTTNVRLNFTIPLTAQWAVLLLHNGSSAGGGDVYWDKLAIFRGVYTGPYLDGDAPGCVWRGTPHASTSIGYPGGV